MESEKTELGEALAFFEQGAKHIRQAIEADVRMEENRKLAKIKDTLEWAVSRLDKKRAELDAEIKRLESLAAAYRQYSEIHAREGRLKELQEKIDERTQELRKLNQDWSAFREQIGAL